MSILDRIGRILAGTANDAIDKLAEPGRDARQIVRELEDQIEKANSSLLDAEAEHEVLRGKMDKADADAAKWQGSAERAMAAGDEGLARECLVKVEEAATVAKGYAATVENFEKTLTDLRARIQDLKHRKDNYAQRTDLIEARAHVARAQETAAAAITDIGSTRNLATDLNKLEDGVLKQEARAAAATRIADQDSGKSLQDRVDALGKATSIEDRMAALKRKVPPQHSAGKFNWWDRLLGAIVSRAFRIAVSRGVASARAVTATSNGNSRLTQAHFGMLRAIAYLGGEWNSASYCPWRVGRKRWESSAFRREVYEIWLQDERRARREDCYARAYGPNRVVCIALCEELAQRGYVERLPGSGHLSAYALTGRGRAVIGSTGPFVLAVTRPVAT